MHFITLNKKNIRGKVNQKRVSLSISSPFIEDYSHLLRVQSTSIVTANYTILKDEIYQTISQEISVSRSYIFA